VLPCKALIDTGAEMSCISEEFYDKISAELSLLTLPVTGVTVVGATGSKSRKVNKQVLIPVEIEGEIFQSCFLIVPQLVVPIILGADWLDEFGAVINFPERGVTLLSGGGAESTASTQFIDPTKCITYIGIGLLYDQELYSPGVDEKTAISNAYLMSRVMKVNAQKRVYLERAKESAEQITPEKIRKVVRDIKGIKGRHRRALIKILTENIQVFSNKPGLVDGFEYEIKVTDDAPQEQYQYSIPLSMQEAMNTAIDKMLNWGIIKKSNTPHLNPLLPVMKSDGSIRPCLDARKTNSKIVPDYDRPLPPEEILQKFHGCKYISSFDLNASFWQVPLTEESKKYTGFLFNGETYVFNVVPFGLRTSVAALNRCLHQLLGPEVLSLTTLYVDDILITSKSIEEHIQHISKLLTRLRELKLTLKFSKTLLCRDECPFLGHVLTPNGIKIDEKKLQGIDDFCSPTRKEKLQEFLGMCVYLQRYHPRYADTAAILYELLQKGHKWQWGSLQETAFCALKKLFHEATMLHHPVPGREFFLETDSSSFAIGAVIYQRDDQGRDLLISCCSRTLKKSERNYNTTEKELLAIVWALTKFRYYIANSPITVRSDHQALSFLMRCRLLNGRLTRWALAIQDYSLNIEFIPGKTNKFADGLSRSEHLLQEADGVAVDDNEVIIAPMKSDNVLIRVP
jgi:hypothetical protein